MGLLYLWLIASFYSCINANFYYEDTYSVHEYPRLKFNCIRNHQDSGTDLFFTEFCLRPSDDNNATDLWSEGIPSDHDPKYTFDQLLQMNISTETLFSWSISINLIEEYQDYLNHRDHRLASKEIFRCSLPWFGSRCQYSFNTSWSFKDHDEYFRESIKYIRNDITDFVAGISCYMFLPCKYNGEPVCLDWSQICDGKIHCIDGEEDESACFPMEINECKSNEYRCHNGQCIPNRFGMENSVLCLDQSNMNYFFRLNQVEGGTPLATNSPRMCPPGDADILCGFGTCIKDLEKCHSFSYPFFETVVSSLGNLTMDCWVALVCLTKLPNGIYGETCWYLSQSGNISKYLAKCDALIQFPSKPIIHHHVYLLFRRDDLLTISNRRTALPAYICFNAQLCEHLSPTFYYKNMSCRTSVEMGVNKSRFSMNWTSMMNIIRPHFYGCMLRILSEDDRKHPSLYCCQNSSKCISKHRILDGLIDCPYHDDEYAFDLSCSIQHSYRFRCDKEKKCFSPLIPRTICPSSQLLDFNQMPFHLYCDGIPNMKPQLIHGQNYTDETDCQTWPCDIGQKRCNFYWNCPHGEDEIDCEDRISCPVNTLICISRLHYDIICLPGRQVADGIIDCLGGSDEPTSCRIKYSTDPSVHIFACFNDTKCLSIGQLCDRQMDCQFGEDEAFCYKHAVCLTETMDDYSNLAADILCQFGFSITAGLKFEMIWTNNSRTRKNQVHRLSYLSSPKLQQNITQMAIFKTRIPNCYLGLSIVVRLARNRFETRCFCPPSLYGDRCQYQNQRVSVSLSIQLSRDLDPKIFMITLINYEHEHEEIHSYEMFVYSSIRLEDCARFIYFNLLYSSRPKNISKDYFVKVSAFNQMTMTHLGSWRFPIPFIFLPVNPMHVEMHIPNQASQTPNRCRLTWGSHGRCLKYLNVNEFFCHCDSGWSGMRCTQSVNCTDCASNSLCLGSHNRRPICACPMNTFGSRCLMQQLCPKDYCKNEGNCIVVSHYSNAPEQYLCQCTEEFTSRTQCKFLKNQITINFHEMEYLSKVIVFTDDGSLVEIGKHPFRIQFSQKLRIFQKSLSFYLDQSFIIVLALIDDNYFMATADKEPELKKWTFRISPKHRCPPIEEIMPTAWLQLQPIQRIKYFHQLCQLRSHINCFMGDGHFCQCGQRREAMCRRFSGIFECQENIFCLNQGKCIQDRLKCRYGISCLCSDCFFGDRCQFYARGLGLTLDDMLRYELQLALSFDQQPLTVKLSAALSTVMLFSGFLNSILSLMTFHSSTTRQVGVGIYLYASSITSIFTITLLNLKFWFLVLTHIYSSVSYSVLRVGCILIEPTVRLTLFIDSWLNASVAVERAITVFRGVNFDKRSSQRTARWVIFILPFLICSSLAYEFIYRDLFYDDEDKRYWCILEYSSRIISYSTFILLFHTLAPFSINICSATYIIIGSASRKIKHRQGQSQRRHFRAQLKEHRHLIISPLVLALLSLPRVIISTLTDCVKTYRNPWLFLIGYFISFLPSVAIFIVFVLPSPLYKEQCQKSIQTIQKWIRSKLLALTGRS